MHSNHQSLPISIKTNNKMNTFALLILALFGAMFHYSSATIDGGVISFGIPGAAVLGAVLSAVTLKAAGVVRQNRGKRDANENDSCLPFANPEIVLSLAKSANNLDCGRKFICEVVASDPSVLSEDEKLVKTVYGTSEPGEDFDLENNNGTLLEFFEEAGVIGSQGGLEACKEFFKECPFDRKSLYQIYLKAAQ